MYDPPFPPQHSAHARLGAHNREARHKLARWLAYKFGKTGVAVVTDRCFVVAWVNPLGQIKFAVPPFERLERHTCTNNPSWKECECRRWFDPESGGPWGRRQTPEHHPLCIFRSDVATTLARGGYPGQGRKAGYRRDDKSGGVWAGCGELLVGEIFFWRVSSRGGGEPLRGSAGWRFGGGRPGRSSAGWIFRGVDRGVVRLVVLGRGETPGFVRWVELGRGSTGAVFDSPN